jgi:D-3-phosphoglycerate dehydrogenase / 2-oxoglutarate reductase
MTAGPALVWEGRFQPIHRGHVAYVGELLRRAVVVTIVVVANELSHGRSPVPGFSRQVDAHHAAERNPWPLWLRHRMVVETLRAAYPQAVGAGRVQVLAGHRLDLDWDLYRRQLLPGDRAFAVPLRDDFEDAKAAAWVSLGERVERVDVSHLPDISGTLVRDLLAAGGELDPVLLPVTQRLIAEHRAVAGVPAPPTGPDRPVVALLTPLDELQRKALDEVADVATAAGVGELAEPDRRRCRVVVLRSGPSLTGPELDLLPALTDVVRSGSGMDNIDLPQLAARGIRLHRRPDVAADAVAELALTGLAALCRRVGPGYRWLLDGTYAKHLLTGEPLADQTLAVWGAGPVGRAVLRQARRLGLQVAFVEHPSVPAHLPTVPRATALRTASAHVLAVPLRAATRGLVDAGWLHEAGLARPYLVNVARHQVVRLGPVEEALRSGGLRGCYLDPVDEADLPELRGFLDRSRGCNVLLTQHQGAQRADVRAVLDSWSVAATLGILRGPDRTPDPDRR